uniref:MAK10-like protein n=1 Tax=Tanacetum cinerariifolium TaxID=118510 RepID=A0A699GZ22_TANCI|nr:MAK10-like protein [Tanacetum cinerariifolium]
MTTASSFWHRCSGIVRFRPLFDLGDANPICTLGDYSRPSHEEYRNTIELLKGNNVGKNAPTFIHFALLDQASNWIERIRAESIPTWEDLTIRLLAQFFPLGRTVKLRNDILIGPHDTQYCMENLEQDFVNYASSRTNEARGKWYTFKPEQNNLGLVSNFMASQDAKLSKFETDFNQQQSEMTNKINIVLKAITDRITRALPSDTVKNLKLNVNSTSLVLFAHSYPTVDPQCLTQIYGSSNTITICPKRPGKSQTGKPEEEEEQDEKATQKTSIPTLPRHLIHQFHSSPKKSMNDDSHKEEPEVGENARVGESEVEYFDIFSTRSEIAYHKYIMYGPIPLILKNRITTEGCSSNLKVPCNIRHVHIEKAYIDLNSPLYIMTQMVYNWIMRRKLDPRENTNGGVKNFTGRIKGMQIFVGNFTYIIDFMIVEDISLIIDPRLSKVVLGKPFVEISDMTHDPPEGVVRFRNETDEIAYKMPIR